jgi:O-antigen/teichoic acid export membrane protein
MKKSSRVSNSIKNVSIGSLLQMFTMLLSFVTRTIFIDLLGNDYLSVNGLFSNILTILSFTELGVGSAIVFSLYEPIANNDKLSVNKLLNLFGMAYKFIACSIIVLGLLVIPFLDYFITDVPAIKENIVLLYCLFLANTVLTYVYSYKRSYLIANQENYKVLLIQQTIQVFQILVQIIVLIYTQNYILFLGIMIFSTIINNVVATIYVNNKYNWIKEGTKDKLSKSEKTKFFANLKSIFIYKFGSVILNGTDNLIIAGFLKTSFVGLCSNYLMIISALGAIISQGTAGLMASIGNYNVNADPNSNEKIFEQLTFIGFWIFGLLSILLACLMNPFILIWLGDDYVLSESISISLAASFYFLFINNVPSSYRSAMGFFKQARTAPLFASIINIGLSIILVKTIGLAGVFIATSITRLLTFCIIDPYYVYKLGFEKSSRQYFNVFIFRILLILVTFLITRFLLSYINIVGICGFLAKGISSLLIVNIIFLIIHFKDKTFIQITNRIYQKKLF